MTHFVCLATNKYWFLGDRLSDRLREFYRSPYTLHLIKDRDHPNWLAAIRDRFTCLLMTPAHPDDYVFSLDADTNIVKPFDVRDIEGELVAAQHFADQTWMRQVKNYDRVKTSTCYVPYDTPYPQTWYMGAFHGGRWSRVRPMYEACEEAQKINIANHHEPGVNDESYINWYLHYHPPTRVLRWPDQFPFVVSDKGGHACLRT